VRIPLLVVDPQGIIRTANRAYLESLPPKVEAVGKSILELGYAGTRIPALEKLLHDVAFRNRPVRAREIAVADGSATRTFIVSIGPFRIENDQRQFLLMTLEDITDRKRADLEIQRLNTELTAHVSELVSANGNLEKEVAERKRAEESLHNIVSELESLSYSVSHDLRAPLRAMLGVAEALAEDYKDKLDENGRDYIRRIATAARRLDMLMQDLLVYNRMGKDHKLPQACSLDQSVAEARANLEKEIKESGASIEVDAPLGTVSGYVSLLDMIVLNLISNALKFVPPGTKPKIRVRAEKDDGFVRLWVEDNGIGIHPDHYKLIFRVFERLHGTEQYPGTGIGLAIVRKGVDKMGGRVGVHSYPGDGSRFWIELPVRNGVKP
jgi:PAS domain S-box-containing protein